MIARDTLLTTKQAAAYTGLPPRTIKHLAESGQLVYEIIAGARPIRRYRKSLLSRLLVERREPQEEP